jgi:formyl-CoA transferase
MQPWEASESLVWAAVSRNKRSITLNLKEEEGQKLFLRLLKDYDILFENFRPGTLEKWGMGINRLREANPNLVIIRVSGYGQTGPYREKAGFGTSATAFSGYTYLSGYPDRPPLSPPIPLADYVTGLFAALGAITALYHRDALGGEGQEVDIALYESMFRMLETAVIAYDRLGIVGQRAGNEFTSSAPVGTFETKDQKWLALTTSTDRTFWRLAEMIGRPDMKTDPRYANNQERVARHKELNELVSDWFSERTAQQITQLCDAKGVPVSPIYSITEIFKDPQYVSREAIIEVEHTTLGKVKVPGVIPKFSKTPGSVHRAGPILGEHNQEVFQELGLSDKEIKNLQKGGII